MVSPSRRPRLSRHLFGLVLWMTFVILTLPWWSGLPFEVAGWWSGSHIPKPTSFAPVWSPENLRETQEDPSPTSLDSKVTNGVMVWRHAELNEASAAARSDVVKEMREMLVLAPDANDAKVPELDELLRLARLDAGLKMSAWRQGEPPLTALPAGQPSLMQAQASLEQAVQETGLAGVWLPPAIVNDAWLLQGLADNLRQANRELQHLTGWPGGVLGLGGRVVWWPIRPQQPGLGGRALTDKAGFTHVVGSWTSLAHEWFHALDNVVSQDSYRYPVNALGASEQIGMWGRSRRTQDAESFSTLLTALREVSLNQAQVDALQQEIKTRASQRASAPASGVGLGLGPRWSDSILALAAAEDAALKSNQWPRQGPWLHWRNAAASELVMGTPRFGQSLGRLDPSFAGFLRVKHADAVYLLSVEETLAYAFEGQTMWGQTPLLASGQEDWASAVMHPTTTESALQTPLFQAFFAKLAPWWRATSKPVGGIKSPNA